MTFGRSSNKFAVIVVIVSTCTCNCAITFRVNNSNNLITVKLEVGDQSTILRNHELVSGCSGNLNAALGPVHEVVSFSRSGNQSAGGVVVVGVGARHCARCLRSGSRDVLGHISHGHSDGVGIQLEVGNQSTILGDHELVGGRGGNLSASLGPIHEVVSHLWGGDHSASGVVVVRVGTGHGSRNSGSCFRNVLGNINNRHSDDVGVKLKVGNQITVLSNHELIGGRGGNLNAALGPVHEVVAHLWGGNQRAGGVVVVRVGTGHGSRNSGSCFRNVLGNINNRHSDDVGVKLKVGNQITVLSNHELIGGRGGNLNAALGPVHEVVAHLWGGNQRAGGVVVVRVGTGHGSRNSGSCFRNVLGNINNRHSDDVGVKLKVGNQITVLSNHELIGGRGGNLNAALGPVHEVVAHLWGGNQRAGGVVVVRVGTGHGSRNSGSCFRNVLGNINNRHSDDVGVKLKVGNQITVLSNHELIGGRGGNLNAALGPVHEVVAHLWGGNQRAGGVVVVRVGTGHGSRNSGSCFRNVLGNINNRHSDDVGVKLKVGNQITVLSNHELIGGRGGNLNAALGPVHEVEAHLRGGNQSAGIVVVICSIACHSAGNSRSGIGDDLRHIGHTEHNVITVQRAICDEIAVIPHLEREA